jgi:hypothetical protein
MHPLKESILTNSSALVMAVVALSFILFQPTYVSQAQLSCDDPPFDVSNIQRVWDKTDFCIFEEGIFDEIISGGVPRDGIPPIDDPEFESIEAAEEWLEPQSPVIVLEVDDVARAYPLAIMTRHEIVNDVIAGQPVAVTFCPLCNSAIVFNREVDGQTMRFGVSGLLRNSDLIMWDDVSQSWWQQFTGTGIVGTYTGHELEILPSTLVGFGAFAENFPDGEVLSRGERSYGRNPYVEYDSSTSPFLFRGTPDDRLGATERVLAVSIDDQAVAYPFPTLAQVGVINDEIAGRPVVAFWQPGAASALDSAIIDQSRDVGMAALYRREVDGEILTFRLDEDGSIHDEQTNSEWNVFGRAVTGELEGTQLRQELAAPHFWFAWAAFQPETEIYEPEEENVTEGASN